MTDEPTKEGQGERPVSDYAPPQRPPAGNGETVVTRPATPKPYLTAAMIAPSGNIQHSDAARLSQMMGPALDQIGKATADKVELSALAYIENARKGAETILAEAKIQADRMISAAETQAAEMRLFAKSVRAYTERNTQQIASFCAVAESVLGTMHSLGDQFNGRTTTGAAAEVADVEDGEHPLDLPKWVKREKT